MPPVRMHGGGGDAMTRERWLHPIFNRRKDGVKRRDPYERAPVLADIHRYVKRKKENEVPI